MRKKIIAGNWKMNKNIEESLEFIEGLRKQLIESPVSCEVVLAPTALALHACSQAATDCDISISGQNVHSQDSGAFTGEWSAQMLASAGAKHCIIGHSERRQFFGDTDDFVKEKLNALLANSITPIVCLGESLEEREAGNTFNRIGLQLLNAVGHLSSEDALKIVVAYEPIWAIGTGKTATPEIAQDAHAYLRFQLAKKFGEEVGNKIRILYGGSVKPANVKELLSQNDIDGALVGGASLKQDSFWKLLTFDK